MVRASKYDPRDMASKPCQVIEILQKKALDSSSLEI